MKDQLQACDELNKGLDTRCAIVTFKEGRQRYLNTQISEWENLGTS